MKVAIITIEIHRQIAGKEFAPNSRFNSWMDINGNLVLSEEEINGIEYNQFDYLKTLPLIEHSEILTPRDTTPPALSPYAVVIPEIYQWAFPENKFVLSGFEIPLDTHNSDKVVNLAYFMWTEFRAELDSGNYEALKRALMPLWDYVELQVINNNLVIL